MYMYFALKSGHIIYLLEYVFTYLFIPAVIGLNEANGGYLYKASDKSFVPLFDETTNSVPTQHQDPQRKDLNGAGETRSWGAHNYSFLCNQTQLSFQFCVLCCRCALSVFFFKPCRIVLVVLYSLYRR